MSCDILIQNATIVDGTGKPGYLGSIAVKGGKITSIGQIDDTAETVIDATGLVVSPGFIDIHTHYDAQLCWDPVLSSSTEHGVTTVVTGNCGVGIAPCRPQDRRNVVLELMAVEGISDQVLEAGIDWQFQTFPEYMSAIGRKGLGPNLAMLVPLSTLRRFVMGETAIERGANEVERKALCQELENAMNAGAMGFSASLISRQVGYKGRPLASQLCSKEEMRDYCHVLRRLNKGIIQLNVTAQLSRISEAELDMLKMVIAESDRPVTWSGAVIRRDTPTDIDKLLATVEPLTKGGHFPQSNVRTINVEINLRSPVLLADVGVVKQVLNRPREEQKQLYASSDFRRDFKADVLRGGKVFGIGCLDCEVHTVKNAALQKYLRRTVRDIANERAADPFDTFFDLALEDDLEIVYLGAAANADKARLREHINDPRIILGMSDGGAHYDMLFEASYPTYLLGYWVREHNAISLEHAVKRMTSEPADFLRLSDRGRLSVGNRADLTIFDPKTIGSAEHAEEVRHDLPAGGMRLYAKAHGINYVIVNGEILMRDRQFTGAMAGQFVGR